MKSNSSKSKEINKSKDNNKRKSIKKNKSSYYQKIYAINTDDEEENKEQNKTLLKLKKLKEQKDKMNSLIKVFKGPQKNPKNGPVWPKVTHPKLPFSNIRKEDPEIKKKRVELLRPSKLYHDFHIIQWIRKKYSDSVIEKSVFSILPDNGKAKIPINESEAKKRQRKMMEYLQSFKGPIGKEKYVKINPKYLYNETTYDKIKKLKDIFLEFDGSGYRKMEMNQLVSLFNQNNIRADIKDIVNLFFKDKKIKKEDYVKLYLNFYQFLTFALTKEQDFRQFMRNIKEKEKKNNGEENKNKDADTDTYLPMNLNLVLDYFINKGKERSSIEKIEKAISEMDSIIKENSIMKSRVSQKEILFSDIMNESSKTKSLNKQKTKNVKPQENSKFNDNRRESNRELNKVVGHYYSSSDITEQKNVSKTNIKPIKKIDNIEEKFEKIDFKQLIQEFSNLFNYNGLNKVEKNDNYKLISNSTIKKNNFKNRINNFSKARRKSQEVKSLSSMNFLSPTNINNNNNKRVIFTNSQNNKIISDTPEIYELADDEDEIMGDAIKQQMNENTILKMNVKNYEKLHDIKLAVNATKKQIKQMNKNLNENKIFINSIKKSSSQVSFKDSKMALNNKNKFKKKDSIKNRSKQLTNYKNNSFKCLRKNDHSFWNNKSIVNNNFCSESNNNYSRYSKTNRTFLNIFCGKSQLINMSQDLTDFASKSKLDYVPPDLLFS